MRQAGLLDSLKVLTGVMLPTVAQGVIIRRPKVVSVAERFALDESAIVRMQHLRRTYGEAPLALKGPGKPRIVLLSHADVKRVLEGSPEPFATETDEKRAALAHFEPKVALISHGKERAERRRFNEEVLETPRQMHSMAAVFADVVNEEMDILLDKAGNDGHLAWPHFFTAWYRLVRRVIFGIAARDDDELTDMLADLRARGNWAFLRGKDKALRARFHERLKQHLERAEKGSLAELIAAAPTATTTHPSHQVAQWLFAFDPGGMASFRALGILATHRQAEQCALDEIAANGHGPHPLPFLRATLLESLRLWPTTPAILRQTTRPVEWGSQTLPANATIMIFAPFFHRDDERQDFAHSFTPQLWLDGGAEEWPLMPFSDGPGLCPAVNFVPMIASLALARILKKADLTLRSSHGLEDQDRLPGALDNYKMEFAIAPRQGRARHSHSGAETR